MARNPLRWRRVAPEGRILMVPMDHGVSMGPVAGITDLGETLARVADRATCVTVHKGMLEQVAPFADQLGILMHLSASTDGAPDPQDKVLVGSVADAVRRGADGVSTHTNVGSLTEAKQLVDLGRVAEDCEAFGMPLVAMMYPRGPKVTNPFDAELVAHAARLGAEVGADAVKVPYTGSAASFEQVVDGATVPVIVAGGPKRDSLEDLLADLRGAAEAGAAGVSIGRNVFQSEDPSRAMNAIADLFQ